MSVRGGGGDSVSVRGSDQRCEETCKATQSRVPLTLGRNPGLKIVPGGVLGALSIDSLLPGTRHGVVLGR